MSERVERLKDLLDDPDWYDFYCGEVQRALPALLAVVDAAKKLAPGDEAYGCPSCGGAFTKTHPDTSVCDCPMSELRAALRELEREGE